MFSLKEGSALARDADVAAAVEAVDRYLETRSGPSAFRKARARVEADADRAAFRGLVELGLVPALLPESAGGSGLAAGAAVLFGERLGWWLAREPFVECVVLPALLALRAGDAQTTAAIGRGQAHAVAWQESAFDLPGRAEAGTTLRREGGGWRLKGSKRFVMGARACERLLVVAAGGDGPVLAVVPSPAEGVARTDKVLADGTHWSDIAFDVRLPQEALRAEGARVQQALVIATAHANLALAGVLHGLQSRVLTITLEYLKTRVQFERPIGAFQALQHRATDLYTHAQITRFLLGEAADAVRDRAEDHVIEAYASRAKARAAASALRIAKEGIQMHGAMGFSDDYDLGLYVKRILVLTAWLGNAQWHRQHLAAIDPLEAEVIA